MASEHLERADDALRIGGAKARGGERIAAGKLGVQRLRRLRLREKPVAGANLFRDVGNVGQPFRQRLEIEPRPADDDSAADRALFASSSAALTSASQSAAE